jgi:SAM-dependent methyltransferase
VKTLLHIGCAPEDLRALPEMFQRGWQEVRFDINPDVQPDIVGDITDMHMVADQSFDAVYSAHNLEHLYPHEVARALAEFHRIVKPAGMAFVTVPDLQQLAKVIAEGRSEETLYSSAEGAVTAIDLVYGSRVAVGRGEVHMAHRTGFTGGSLRRALYRAGFQTVSMNTTPWTLWAVGYKQRPA